MRFRNIVCLVIKLCIMYKEVSQSSWTPQNSKAPDALLVPLDLQRLLDAFAVQRLASALTSGSWLCIVHQKSVGYGPAHFSTHRKRKICRSSLVNFSESLSWQGSFALLPILNVRDYLSITKQMIVLGEHMSRHLGIPSDNASTTRIAPSSSPGRSGHAPQLGIHCM